MSETPEILPYDRKPISPNPFEKDVEDKFRKEFLVRETNKKIIEQQFSKPDNPVEISKIKYEGESKLSDILKNKSNETSLTTPTTTEKSNTWIWILLIIVIVIALIIIFYFVIRNLTTPKSMKYNVKSEISPNVSLIPMG